MVPWVVGKRKALARAMAMTNADARGQPWSRMTQAQRDKEIAAADKVVCQWVAAGVLATFKYEYREKPVDS